MDYIQNYNPFGNIWFSSIIAFLPIVAFFVCLVWLRLKGHVAGFITMVLALIIAIVIYKMPTTLALSSFLYGFLYGLWPISWIIIAAIFLYKISVKSGYFDILRDSITSITPDQRLQAVLIAFCFGAFLEGAIGFGGPVAITAAILVGLGFRPLYAAGLCLIANTAPVAFGAVGIPIIALSKLVDVPELEISRMIGLILPPLSVFVPFFLVFLMNGIKGVKETWPVVLVAGLSFAIVQHLTATYLGPELPDIASAIVSILATTLFLKFVWKPKTTFRFDSDSKNHSNEKTTKNASSVVSQVPKHSLGQIIMAWLPFVVLIGMIIIWTLPGFKALFGANGPLKGTILSFNFESLKHIFQTTPVVAHNTSVKSIFALPLISTVGTSIFLTAIITIFMFKVKLSQAVQTFGETLNEMKYAILTIGLVLSFAYISNYSGMSATLGLALSETGGAFSFFSPVVGWIGVFLTGSDTSSNLLFGGLQKITANALNIPEVLFLAANTIGGVVGKMISPQSIAVACAAVGLVGKESELFRFTLKYSVAFILIIGVIISGVAYFIPDAVPNAHALTQSTL